MFDKMTPLKLPFGWTVNFPKLPSSIDTSTWPLPVVGESKSVTDTWTTKLSETQKGWMNNLFLMANQPIHTKILIKTPVLKVFPEKCRLVYYHCIRHCYFLFFFFFPIQLFCTSSTSMTKMLKVKSAINLPKHPQFSYKRLVFLGFKCFGVSFFQNWQYFKDVSAQKKQQQNPCKTLEFIMQKDLCE